MSIQTDLVTTFIIKYYFVILLKLRYNTHKVDYFKKKAADSCCTNKPLFQYLLI